MVQQLPNRSEKPSSSNHPFFRCELLPFSYKIWPSNHMDWLWTFFRKKVASSVKKVLNKKRRLVKWGKGEDIGQEKSYCSQLNLRYCRPKNHSQLFGSPLNHRRILDSWTANIFGPEQRQIALSLAYQRKGKHSTLQLKKAMTNPPFLDVYKIHPWRDIQPATNLFERPSSAGLPRMDLIHRNQPRCSNGVSTMCDTVLERKRAETTILAKRDL